MNLSQLPSMNTLLSHSGIDCLIQHTSRDYVKNKIQEVLSETREKIKNNQNVDVTLDTIVAEIKKRILGNQSSQRIVINATGTIIHTNLGRSLFAHEEVEELEKISEHYSNLEYDLDTGKRGIRYQHVHQLLCQITGAEDALVVNNNAAAVMLTLATLVPDKNVIISRGELVEIGGSFRIPDVITASGGTLKEVGSTNKTHLRDYEEAIDGNTGAIMKVHQSNFRMIGFTEQVDIKMLSKVAHQNNLPVIDDLGSGLLIDMTRFGLPYEPTVSTVIKDGADVVTFSGDKLLGGPQAGIIVGKKKWIEPMKQHPLLRALRIDKLTLFLLEKTLSYYAISDLEAISNIPTLKMLSKTKENLKLVADKILHQLESYYSVQCIEATSVVGGGAYPEYGVPTYLVLINVNSPEEFQKKLRKFPVPIITRIYHQKIALDVRTIQENEVNILCEELLKINDNSFENDCNFIGDIL